MLAERPSGGIKDLGEHAAQVVALDAGAACFVEPGAQRLGPTGGDVLTGALGNDGIEADGLRCLRRALLAAESGYLLGRKAQASQAAEMALAVAERLGAAPLLRDAYAVSGHILGRPRVGADAVEIGRILAA